MKPRHARTLTAETMFERVAYGSLDWPLKTVRLQRDSLEDFSQRLITPRFSLSEVHHENSKLFPGMLEELVATHIDPGYVRREFLRRRQSAVANLAKTDKDEHVLRLLRAVTDACVPELFYAIELRAFDGRRILVQEPLSNISYVVKDVAPDEGRTLRAALEVAAAGEPPAATCSFVFVVGSLARNDLLYGTRGYRRTLLEAGGVTQVALRLAIDAGMAARARFEFLDRVIDAVLESDGTEESTLVIIDLEGPCAA